MPTTNQPAPLPTLASLADALDRIDLGMMGRSYQPMLKTAAAAMRNAEQRIEALEKAVAGKAAA